MAQPAALPFDVRTGIREAELDDEAVQLTYDAINRMVVLVGDIPFDRLFVAPIQELAPLILPRITVASRRRLLRAPAVVEQLMRELVASAGSNSIGSFFVQSRHEVSSQINLLLRKLRREGVRIPLPVSDSTREAARQKVIDDLVRVYPGGTFRALFDPAMAQPGPAPSRVIRQARRLGLFGWFANDRCCKCEVTNDLPTDCDCFTSTGKWCKIDDQGICMGASDPCPGARKVW